MQASPRSASTAHPDSNFERNATLHHRQNLAYDTSAQLELTTLPRPTGFALSISLYKSDASVQSYQNSPATAMARRQSECSWTVLPPPPGRAQGPPVLWTRNG